MPQAMNEALLVAETPLPARPEPLYVKLPARGRRSVLHHDAVASNQRSRLIGAMIEEVAQRGYACATLARLVALAGVSKRAFHEQILSASFGEAPDVVTPPPLIAEGIVCGVERITRQRLLAGDPGRVRGDLRPRPGRHPAPRTPARSVHRPAHAGPAEVASSFAPGSGGGRWGHLGDRPPSRRTRRHTAAGRVRRLRHLHRARPSDRRRGCRPGDPRLRRRALIFRVGDPGTLVPPYSS